MDGPLHSRASRHYTEVPVAKLQSDGSDEGRSFARQYPSPGLSDEQLCGALWSVGLPPDVTKVTSLAAIRTIRWSDRDIVREDPIAYDWHRENFTAYIARYLNSGFPVLLAAGNHVQLICGYLRNRQLQGMEPTNDPGRIEKFVLHDDGQGPYRLVGVGEIMLQAAGSTDHLVVPLPPGLNLAGDGAEEIGTSTVELVLPRVAERARGEALPNAESLVQSEERLVHADYAVRTYGCDSNDFKASYAARCTDADAQLTLSVTPLPKYVWVVEIIDRAERDSRNPPVIGEVVVDATPTRRNAQVLFIHFPGWVAMHDPISDEDADFPCGSDRYNSGRWAQESPGAWNYGSPSRRFKTAGTP